MTHIFLFLLCSSLFGEIKKPPFKKMLCKNTKTGLRRCAVRKMFFTISPKSQESTCIRVSENIFSSEWLLYRVSSRLHDPNLLNISDKIVASLQPAILMKMKHFRSIFFWFSTDVEQRFCR